jgi:hypothetical protein
VYNIPVVPRPVARHVISGAAANEVLVPASRQGQPRNAALEKLTAEKKRTLATLPSPPRMPLLLPPVVQALTKQSPGLLRTTIRRSQLAAWRFFETGENEF